MEIRIHTTNDELNIAFTSWLKEVTKDKESVTIALSGGSTPKSLFQYWANLQNDEIDWKKFKIFWGDERCVAPTDDESNYKMTKETLLDCIPVPEENIFRIRGEEDPEKEIDRYSEILRREVRIINRIPSFDIVMLGMGSDGHTASIFPDQMKLWDSEDWCIEAIHPESGQKRISLTGKVINNTQNAVFLVTGISKAEKVNEIFKHPEESFRKYPAARVRPTDGTLIWFVDEDALYLLN